MTSNLMWAEIDLGAIAHNVRELRRITQPGARLLVAVKANAYGHGAVETARTALQNGAEALGVARIEEGLQLRDSGLTAPILIFGYTPPERTAELLDRDLTPSLFSLDSARRFAAAARAAGKVLPVHLKVDTGMGRLGLLCDDLRPESQSRAVDEILAMAALEGIDLQGIFTHFATADAADKQYAHLQFNRFSRLLEQLKDAGLRIALRHAANSGAIIDLPETHLDMVRAGIAVYGLPPSAELLHPERIALKPAMQLKSRIVHLKTVPAGTSISYGCTYTTDKPTTIATVAVGYGDGYPRLLSNRGCMLAGGRRVPIVGRVCMDLTMIDVGTVPDPAVGDEIVLLGRQGTQELTADELAAQLETINYEVVTALTARVKRVFSTV